MITIVIIDNNNNNGNIDNNNILCYLVITYRSISIAWYGFNYIFYFLGTIISVYSSWIICWNSYKSTRKTHSQTETWTC